MNQHQFTKALVRDLLERRHDRDWTIQGFGMLRTYFGDDLRLAVWDSHFRVPDVSLIHDHVWCFKSLIVAGALHNQRYIERPDPTPQNMTYQRMTIRPGEGTIPLTEEATTFLERSLREDYTEGDTYIQRAEEIHASYPADGTVTLVERHRTQGGDAARVFWPVGGYWVSAEPRKATRAEIDDICQRSLGAWFL